jgi:4-deoxy-L-threo-5-hexosulose-uronate ketol-isomerase
MGAREVSFPAPGALLSAERARPSAYAMRKLTLEGANPLALGTQATANERSVYQLILPGLRDSASLCLGLTILKPGSVWNTMPPHVHARCLRSTSISTCPRRAASSIIWASPRPCGTS